MTPVSRWARTIVIATVIVSPQGCLDGLSPNPRDRVYYEGPYVEQLTVCAEGTMTHYTLGHEIIINAVADDIVVTAPDRGDITMFISGRTTYHFPSRDIVYTWECEVEVDDPYELVRVVGEKQETPT